MSIIRQDALNERANNLEAANLNGLRLVLVELVPSGAPVEARLELYFHNTNEVANILADISINPTLAGSLFPISGGHRLPAGTASGQVQVTAVAAGAEPDRLELTVAPIGDYSTYTLGVVYQNIDPLFGELPFKFRPGCFTNDCDPEWKSSPARAPSPVIDYLAKDYDSFRHTLNAAMMQRVPGWQSTSEADLDQVLIDLFSTAGDELSDFQDRVLNEAYLGTARKRVSLARHARLMDYHVHQGNQAVTWLALQISGAIPFTLPPEFSVKTSAADSPADAVEFATREEHWLHPLLNELGLYTWSDATPSLAAGSTSADLVLTQPGQVAASTIRNAIRDGRVTHLLIQEHLNPATGREPGRDIAKRQVLQLLAGNAGAETHQDPLTGTWFIRVFWEEKDQLQQNYCFTVFCPGGRVDNVSLFHGNLAGIHQGRFTHVTFQEPGTRLVVGTGRRHLHYERPLESEVNRGVVCHLPDAPLAYLQTPLGGEVPPRSTLHVEVELPGGGKDPWDEQISLVHSDDSAENGDHFTVETDELQHSVIRFGNGNNGRWLPSGALVHCDYQIGGGLQGNVGADRLIYFRPSTAADPHPVTACWNPRDVTNGRDPEPVEKILRAAPEAYRARQLRAITLQDYVRRAEELPEVSRAAARYAWTGSWRTVRVAIDPVGTTILSEETRIRIARHLEAVRLIGEDLEIRPPIFVPLEIHVSLCIHPEFWPEDVRSVLEQEFSESYTPDGRPGFFHMDAWTFGQPLRASQISGRVHEVAGVEHIIAITLKRWNDPAPVTSDIVQVRANEILRVRNDPDHMEEGFIRFELKGGRQ